MRLQAFCAALAAITSVSALVVDVSGPNQRRDVGESSIWGQALDCGYPSGNCDANGCMWTVRHVL